MPVSFLIFATVAITLTVPVVAYRARGKPYGIYSLITLVLSLPAACLVFVRVQEILSPAFAELASLIYAWGLAATATHMIALARPRLRSPAFRRGISMPGMAFMAGGALSVPWLLLLLPVRLLLALIGADELRNALVWLDLLPAMIALLSVATSRGARWEIVQFSLTGRGSADLRRAEVHRRAGPTDNPREPGVLRLVQITDPHLGPWQPIDRLHERISKLIDLDPDLIVLTGDLLTMEGAGSPGALARALAPLRRLPDRCFAIFGNHDHEWPEEVRDALQSAGVCLLDDEEALLETPAGSVQLVGADWRGKSRAEQIPALLEKCPRRPGYARILLLHDPAAFHHVPADDVDLVLSGHTHGGQVGLLSLGIDWTVLSRTRWPDNGLFVRGRSRLYVHRGTGFYGFPLRIGVPGEASRLDIELPRHDEAAEPVSV